MSTGWWRNFYLVSEWLISWDESQKFDEFNTCDESRILMSILFFVLFYKYVSIIHKYLFEFYNTWNKDRYYDTKSPVCT